MRVVIFCHSLVSDWNHGNAHFLRGVVSELIARGHYGPRLRAARRVERREPASSEHGRRGDRRVRARLSRSSPGSARATTATTSTWTRRSTAPTSCSCTSGTITRSSRRSARTARRAGLVRAALPRHAPPLRHRSGGDRRLRPGALRRRARVRRGDPRRVSRARLGGARMDMARGGRRATLPPACRPATREGDLVWIGNWGDDERTAELHEFLIEPDTRARPAGAVPRRALSGAGAARRSSGAGIEYGGWLPNYDVPDVFARFRVTVHVPRRPYVTALPGIPTIRPFEALACGIPLVSAPWDDGRPVHAGRGLPLRRDGAEMTRQLARAARRSGAPRAAGRPRPPARSSRPTPAPTASTSCSRSCADVPRHAPPSPSNSESVA